MIHTILTDPNPILRKRAEDVPIEDIAIPETQKLIDDMIETMYAANGIGIAGPQIGKLLRIFIAERGEHDPVAVINPTIIAKSWRKVQSEEGCLSIPGKYGIVKRHKSVTIRAYDREGKPTTIKATGQLALIFQHEIDHLDGMLFTDKAKNIKEIKSDDEPKI